LALIAVSGFVYGLQRLLFGPLRPVEIEQLYERGWFAITEWLFAMSTFRDEFGVWFLIMFVSLFVGKLWGWLADGRIETLEQQPPSNPRLFHSRLIASLTLYVLFAVQMFRYCLDTVFYEARPGVMVMFVFEFAIISISAFSTILRYMLWAEEYRIIKKQTKERKEALKAAIRQAQEQSQNQGTEEGQEAADAPTQIPQTEAEVDEEDIEVPGWEAKGSWLFALDIGTDFLKLVAYMAFFTILTVFYGIPIYIIRDMYLTLRSFTKRVSDYIRYQHATRDMHARYPDATAEELEPDNTCIVCREEMRPWHAVDAQARRAADPLAHSVNERHRPKKLPCGHILHFGCLRSWLERQQACPICRRSVLAQPQRPEAGPPGAAQAPNNNEVNNQRPPANGGRVFQLGPLRFEVRRFGADQDALRNIMVPLGQVGANGNDQPQATPQQPAAIEIPATSTSTQPISPQLQQARSTMRSAAVAWQLQQIEQQIQQEIQALNIAGQRLQIIRALQSELDRFRAAASQPAVPVTLPFSGLQPTLQFPGPTLAAPMNMPLAAAAHGLQQSVASGAGAQDALPEGLILPPDWTAIPLRPFADAAAVPQAGPSQAADTPPVQPSAPPFPQASGPPPPRRPSSASSLFEALPRSSGAATAPNGHPPSPARDGAGATAPPLSPQPLRRAPSPSSLDHAAAADPRRRPPADAPARPPPSLLEAGADAWSFATAPTPAAAPNGAAAGAAAKAPAPLGPRVEDADDEEG